MSTSSPRIQIWTGRIGGHIRIAQSVARALSERCPPAQVQICDIYSPSLIAGPAAWATNSYDRLVSLSPRAWGAMWHLTDQPAAIRLMRWFGERLTRPAALDALTDGADGQAPDAILRVIADLGQQRALERRVAARGLRRPPLITFIGDLVSIHRGWVEPASEWYLVPTAEAAAGLRRLGVLDRQLVHVGFPIRSAQFCRGAEPVHSVSHRLTEQAPRGERLRVLVMGGTSGSGRIVADVERLLSSDLPIEVTVVCGKNARLAQRLNRWPRAGLRVLGYTEDVPALMRWADLLISKAGPGTCCEAVASGLPLVINGHLPGQEDGNTELFVRAGVACAAPSPDDTLALVGGFAADRTRLRSMTNPALAAETCDAASRIAEHVLALAIWHRPNRGEVPSHGI